MSKAVQTTKNDPTYDYLLEQRYHFPRTYLRQIEAARGDWIVCYEPQRPSGDLMKTGGKQAYFATARIAGLIQDPFKADHFYALVKFMYDSRYAPITKLTWEAECNRRGGQCG